MGDAYPSFFYCPDPLAVLGVLGDLRVQPCLKLKSHRPGTALVLLMILVAVVAGMGAAYLSSASIRVAAADSYADSIDVGYAAESGVEHGLCLLAENLAALAGSDSTPLGPYTVRSGGPAYTISALSLGGGRYRLIGAALDGRCQRARSALARVDNGFADLLRAGNPEVYWRLGDTSGWTVREDGGFHNGQYVGSILLNQSGALMGEENGAAGLNVVRSRVVIPDNHHMQAAQGTVLLWYYDMDPLNNEALFSKEAAGRGTGGGLGIWVEHDKLKVKLESATADNWINVTGQPQGAWNMLVVTFGPGGMNLYVNDQLVGSNAYTGGMVNNTEPITLGCSQRSRTLADLAFLTNPTVNAGMAEWYSGRLDEVAFFSRALSGSEVSRLYAARRQTVVLVKWED